MIGTVLGHKTTDMSEIKTFPGVCHKRTLQVEMRNLDFSLSVEEIMKCSGNHSSS